MKLEQDFPAPWRCCRLQVLAFLVLNFLGSCSRPAATDAVSVPVSTAQTVQSAPEKPG